MTLERKRAFNVLALPNVWISRPSGQRRRLPQLFLVSPVHQHWTERKQVDPLPSLRFCADQATKITINKDQLVVWPPIGWDIHTCHIFLGPFWDFLGIFLGQMTFFWDKYCKILGHFLGHFEWVLNHSKWIRKKTFSLFINFLTFKRKI